MGKWFFSSFFNTSHVHTLLFIWNHPIFLFSFFFKCLLSSCLCNVCCVQLVACPFLINLPYHVIGCLCIYLTSVNKCYGHLRLSSSVSYPDLCELTLHRCIRVSLCEHIIRLISIAQTAGHSLTPAVGGCYKPPPPTAHLSHTHLFSSSTARTLVDFTFRYTHTHTPPLWTTLISRRLHPSQLTALAQGYTSPTAFCFFPPSAFTGHKSYDRAFKRGTSRNPLRSGDVWSRLTVLCFSHLGVRLPRCTIQRRDDDEASAGLKKERDGNKGQFDYSFPIDGCEIHKWLFMYSSHFLWVPCMCFSCLSVQFSSAHPLNPTHQRQAN